MTPIKSGDLRHRVVLQKPTPTVKAGGARDLNTDDQWTTYATVWGEVKPLTGRELERAKSFGSTITTNITVRYWKGTPPIDSTHRVKWLDPITSQYHSYSINAVIDEEARHVKQTLLSTELF